MKYLGCTSIYIKKKSLEIGKTAMNGWLLCEEKQMTSLDSPLGFY